MRFAIIGLGFIAERHAKAIRDVGGTLAWVCDIEQPAIEKFFETLHGGYPEGMHFPKATKYYWEITDVDYVVICAPNHLHAEMMKYFLPRGVKVIVEKPPVIRQQDYDLLKDRSDINVMLQLRYHPEMARLKEFAKEGNRKGKMTVRVKRDNSYWEGWKGDKEKSGGLLFNLGIHYLDALLHCFSANGHIALGAINVKDDYAKLNLEIGSNEFDITVEVLPDNKNQTREIVFGDEVFQFSKKDNLSFEELHTAAYRDILNGKGIKLSDCEKLISLLCYLK